jgi:acetyltransferase-like isoleucine patch superfamily enzyme
MLKEKRRVADVTIGLLPFADVMTGLQSLLLADVTTGLQSLLLADVTIGSQSLLATNVVRRFQILGWL